MKTLLGLSALLWTATAPFASAGSATWSSNPASTDWSVASNWTPATVPNGSSDVATFGNSTVTQVDLFHADNGGLRVESVSAVQFNPGASAFTITGHDFGNLVLTGVGIVNQSGVTQHFVEIGNEGDLGVGAVVFEGSAGTGTQTTFFNGGAKAFSTVGGGTGFYNTANAGSATITNEGGSLFAAWGGGTLFGDAASAATATIISHGAFAAGNLGGMISFQDDSSAAQAVITNDGADNGALGAQIFFSQSSNAGSAIITNNGATVAAGSGGAIFFRDSSSGATSQITNNGGTVSGAGGGTLCFTDQAFANKAILIANGGTSGGGGGQIVFSEGTTARNSVIKVYGNGSLDVSGRGQGGLQIGSLEGDGSVFLGRQIFGVGLNNLDTVFAGVLMDGGVVMDSGGSLNKLGQGSLALTNASTYTGGTTVAGGVLRATNPNGSATGTGAVIVNAGTLGGTGTIAGAVTVGTGSGTGAILQPSVGLSQTVRLTVQSGLTFNADGTYTCKLSTQKAKADQVVASGVTIASGAQFTFTALANKRLAAGTFFTVISNTAGSAISGTFANLADGSTLTAGRNKLLVSYTGGDGNDLTLTVQ